MENLIVLLVIFVIIGIAIAKIVIEKKKGAKCIGCPVYKEKDNNGCSACNAVSIKEPRL